MVRTMQRHPKPCAHCHGSGWLDDIKEVAKKAVGAVGRVGATALGTAVGGPAGAALAGTLANAGLGALGMGKPKMRRAKRPGSAPTWLKERNAVVKRISVERGVSIPEASKIVKAEGLWHK